MFVVFFPRLGLSDSINVLLIENGPQNLYSYNDKINYSCR